MLSKKSLKSAESAVVKPPRLKSAPDCQPGGGLNSPPAEAPYLRS
jgi:hypothetical protein